MSLERLSRMMLLVEFRKVLATSSSRTSVLLVCRKLWEAGKSLQNLELLETIPKLLKLLKTSGHY